MNPIPSLDSGMRFPLELPLGKHVPLYGRIPGRSFRLRRHPETTSQSERGFRDALSAWAAIGKAHPTLRCCGIFFTSAPCTEFDSPRCGRGSVDAAHGRLRFDKHRIRFESEVCAENPRICFANPHRLRPPAGVLARGLKTLTRFLYARALHRVRFSAVSISNKKAGRYVYLPACNYWWRRGESNSGPRKPPDWHLQAQSLVLSRTLCAQRHARGVLTGSVLACVIPITCAGAFP